MSFTIHCTNGNNLRLGHGVLISSGCKAIDDGPIEIGDDVIFGENVTICSESARGVKIAPRCWLGDGAQIKPGARIGEGALICAGAVVEGEVPPFTVIEGNPGRVTWHLR